MLTSKRVLVLASGLSLLFVAPVLAGIADSASNGIAVMAKSQGTMATSSTKISINKASAADLQKVKGIGPITANLIIKNRPYKSVNDLVTKKILSATQFQSMKSSLGL
jgi:competence protein ComEA